MIMFKLFFYVSNILSRIENLFRHSRFNLIIDREIFMMLDKDGKEVEEVILRKDFEKNKRFEEYIWDKYFPKPIYYYVSYDSFLNSKSDNEVRLNLISVKNDKILGFELGKRSDKLTTLNFYDINDQIINRELGSKFKNYEVVKSSKEQNIESILNSFDYLRCLGSLEASYRVIHGSYHTFIKVIHDLMKKTEEIINFNEPIFLKSWETLSHIIQITNTLTIAIVTVVIPSLNKDEYVRTLDEFKENLDGLSRLFIDLKNTISEQIKIFCKENPKNDVTGIIEFMDKITFFDEDLKKVGPSSIIEKYSFFLKEIRKVTDFVKKVKDKNNINTQISLDCDIKKVDSFVEKYAPYLLEYCKLLEKCDTIYLHEYYYYESIKYGGVYFEHIKKMFEDLIIALEMKKYVFNFQTDKNDLLIFFQSDYFKKKLPGRIIYNLDTLISLLWFKKKFQGAIQGQEVELSENDQSYMKQIRDFRTKWIKIFDSNNPSDPLSISKIIDYMPIKENQNDILTETTQSTSAQQESINQPLFENVKVSNESNPSKNKISENATYTQEENKIPLQKSFTDIKINPVKVNTASDKDTNLKKEKPNVENGDNKANDTIKGVPVEENADSRMRNFLHVLIYISIGVVAFSLLVGFIFYVVKK